MNHEFESPKIPRISKFVDIGTHKLHVELSDLASEYSIVLEAGGGDDSGSYKGIQDTLAQRTELRVLSYDRSGFGRSELGPVHFSALDEVQALKTCLEIQGFAQKLILAGISYGGYLIQLFTARYPDLVSGLVLIDPMNIRFVDYFGLDNLKPMMPYFDPPRTNAEKAGNRMIDLSFESFSALHSQELPQHVPAILLTSGIPPFSTGWRRCHEEMVSKSEKHQLIIAEGNHHDIVRENPMLVIDIIIKLIGQISEIN